MLLSVALFTLTNDTLELTGIGGAPGAGIQYELAGDPLELYVLLLSTTQGPTPLALVDGTDARALSVGIEFLDLTRAGLLDGQGEAEEVLFLPNDPALSGLALNAQALTLPGSFHLVDEISNLSSITLASPGETYLAAGALSAPRQWARSTELDDGRVLISGGRDAGAGGAVLGTLELYDPHSQLFSGAAPLATARSEHSATLLADGRVLLAGGLGAGGLVLGAVEIFDPQTGTSSPVAPMHEPRYQHTATLLQNGRILVSGGLGLQLGQPMSEAAASARQSCEIYDPLSDSWSLTTSLPRPTYAHAATRLPNGRVLITGGVQDITPAQRTPSVSTPLRSGGFGSSTTVDLAQPEFRVARTSLLYDPVQASMTPVADMPKALAYHGQTLTVGGDVLVAAGASVNFQAGTIDAKAGTFSYDSQGGSWSPLPDPTVNVWGPDGLRCIPTSNCPFAFICDGGVTYATAGGYSSFTPGVGGQAVAQIAILDENLSAWTVAGSLSGAREGTTVAVVEGGMRALVVGATGASDTSADLHMVVH